MSPGIVSLVGALAGLVGLAALITAVRESLKWWAERKTNEIGSIVTSLSEVLNQMRLENARLVEANDRKDGQIQEQDVQIERLEKENDRLEILVRSVTQQSMDTAQELQRERSEHRDLMRKHNQLLGRLGHGDNDVA